LDDHSSGPAVTGGIKLPTRASRVEVSLRAVSPLARGPAPARGPYLALLPVGLAVPSLLPSPRWALTPPFHPYSCQGKSGLFSVALSLGLPPPGVTRHRYFMEPGLSSRRPRKTDTQPSSLPRKISVRPCAPRRQPRSIAGNVWGGKVRGPRFGGPRFGTSRFPRYQGAPGRWRARSSASALSTASSGPSAHGRKRSRKAARTASGAAAR
jgi:hypothetical protein